MSTVGSNFATLVDIAASESDKMLVDLLSQENAILEDMPWVQCNDGQGHKTKIRTGLPVPTWRALYQGVQPTKGTVAPVRDACGNLEDFGEVDELEYQLAADDAETWRMQEDAAHIEGIGQEAAKTFFYGNVTLNPEKFHGLAPRYNALSGVNTADNVVNGLGVGADNASVWLVGWGPLSCHGIYPKGTMAGLKPEDLGRQVRQNSDGSRFTVLMTKYAWQLGLTLRDWRAAGRIANLDVSDLRDSTATGETATKNLIRFLIILIERVERPKSGRQVLYTNKTVRTALRIGIQNRIANNLTWETVEGRRVMIFDEIEVHRSDALLNTEAALV